MAPRAKKAAKKMSKRKMPAKKPAIKLASKHQIDYQKVRKAMKRNNVKKLDKESVQMIAKELNYPLTDLQHEKHLRGKMLATVKNWNQKDD